MSRCVASYNARIYKDEASVANGLGAYKARHPAALVRALTHEVADLRTLRDKLSHESASTPRGTRGKHDITTGLGLIAIAYEALALDIKNSSATRPVAQSKVLAAIKTDKKGRDELTAGLKLLG